MDDKPEINLKRFKSHERKIPWQLIRKVVIAAVIIGLSIYLSKSLKEKSNSNNEIELDLFQP